MTMAHARAAGLLRYAVVGILTLAIYMLLGGAMHRLQAPLFWEATLPFAAAVIFNYLSQRSWVFADSRPMSSSLLKYALMIAMGYTINYFALLALLPRMPLHLAQLTAVVLVVLSNAVFSFSWVFPGSGAVRTR
jgi:putative flippase GtrA